MPTSYAIVMVRAARELGFDLLDGLSLTLAALEASEFMAMDDYLVLLDRFTQCQKAPDWGFRFGERLTMSAHGPLGFGAVSAPTVRDGLLFLARYLPTRNGYTRATIEQHGHALHFVIHHDPVMNAFRSRASETLAVIFQSYIETAGASAEPLVWRFPYPPPPHRPAYERWLRGGCYFDATDFRLEVPRSVSMVPSPFRNDAAYRSTMAQCEALMLESSDDTLERKVRGILASAMERRVMESVPITGIPVAEEIAPQLGISRRTLIRRLKDAGTTFQSIRDELMKMHIETLIGDPALALRDIAHRLGYSEAANFTRACHRMFGASPGTLRQRRE